ncbi:MAG: UPF0149 family protein [Gemmatimonadota bacterium]
MPREIRSGRRAAERVLELPLDGEEQRLLGEFLEFGCPGGELDGFMMLDGFLTALVLVPGPQMPASWHASVFGGRNGAELLERLAVAEERGMLALLVRHWRSVRRREFASGEWALPEGWEWSCRRAARWASGFLVGMRRTEAEWAGRLSRAQVDELLVAVERIAAFPQSGSVAAQAQLVAQTDAERELMDDELVAAVQGVWQALWGRGR